MQGTVARALAGAGASFLAAGSVTHCASDKTETRGPVFDPEALERGAKALREINASSNAKQVIELSKQQEVTKQAEAKRDEQKNAAVAAQFAAVRPPLNFSSLSLVRPSRYSPV
jgi:ATPase family AAA domain-containing protein 3A/B